MKKAKEDIPERFWREYESMDMLDRRDKIKHIVNMVDNLFNLKDEKLRKYSLASFLQSYFDDLIDYMSYRRVRGKK